MFEFYCPICGYLQNMSFTLAGKQTACPCCKGVISLPIRKTIQEETVDYFSRDEGDKPPSKLKASWRQ
jgi:hypothetical protein